MANLHPGADGPRSPSFHDAVLPVLGIVASLTCRVRCGRDRRIWIGLNVSPAEPTAGVLVVRPIQGDTHG